MSNSIQNPILGALSLPDTRLHLTPIELRNRTLMSRGIVFFDGEIANEECVCGGPNGFSELCRDFMFLHLINAGLGPKERKPIWIILNSPGGSVLDGFGFYDLIGNSVENGIEVNIVGMGSVASIATMILQAGTRRFSFPNTQFLIHEVSQRYLKDEKVSEGKERLAETERLNLRMSGIIADRVGMDVQKLIEFSKKKEFWLDAESALKFGLIDGVLKTISFGTPLNP